MSGAEIIYTNTDTAKKKSYWVKESQIKYNM
jgi:hypothetical protein